MGGHSEEETVPGVRKPMSASPPSLFLSPADNAATDHRVPIVEDSGLAWRYGR